jgi:hypothetical protein
MTVKQFCFHYRWVSRSNLYQIIRRHKPECVKRIRSSNPEWSRRFVFDEGEMVEFLIGKNWFPPEARERVRGGEK